MRGHDSYRKPFTGNLATTSDGLTNLVRSEMVLESEPERRRRRRRAGRLAGDGVTRRLRRRRRARHPIAADDDDGARRLALGSRHRHQQEPRLPAVHQNRRGNRRSILIGE